MKKLILICVSIFTFSNICFASGISPTVTTADCDNATLSTYGGTTNLQADWGPNKIDLYWYDGNTLLDVQDSADSCFYDGALTIPDTPPTKTGYTFDGWKVRDLPHGYTKLEYIQFCTACKINTQKRIGANFEIYATIMYYSDPQINSTVLDSTSVKSFDIGYYTDTLLYSYISGAARNGGIKTPGPNIRFTFGISPEWIQHYNGLRNNPSRPYTGNANLIVGGNSSNTGIMQVYNVKMYNDGNLDLDLIPARRNSDNTIGMFDTVSGTFFTNSGTGSFTAGPDQ